MKILKNLFGDGSKIHADDIITGSAASNETLGNILTGIKKIRFADYTVTTLANATVIINHNMGFAGSDTYTAHVCAYTSPSINVVRVIHSNGNSIQLIVHNPDGTPCTSTEIHVRVLFVGR